MSTRSSSDLHSGVVALHTVGKDREWWGDGVPSRCTACDFETDDARAAFAHEDEMLTPLQWIGRVLKGVGIVAVFLAASVLFGYCGI